LNQRKFKSKWTWQHPHSIMAKGRKKAKPIRTTASTLGRSQIHMTLIATTERYAEVHVLIAAFSETTGSLFLGSCYSVHFHSSFISYSMPWRRMETLTFFRGSPMAEPSTSKTVRSLRQSSSPSTCRPCQSTSPFSSNWDYMALPDPSRRL
jgi:hypothetical protein